MKTEIRSQISNMISQRSSGIWDLGSGIWDLGSGMWDLRSRKRQTFLVLPLYWDPSFADHAHGDDGAVVPELECVNGVVDVAGRALDGHVLLQRIPKLWSESARDVVLECRAVVRYDKTGEGFHFGERRVDQGSRSLAVGATDQLPCGFKS